MPPQREIRLLDLCEPFFMRVCETTGLAKGGAVLSFSEVQDDLKRTLAGCKQQAMREGLRAGWEHIEPPLRCFVDSMIENGAPKLAGEWQQARLAAERPFLIGAGESAFYQTYLNPDLMAARAEHTDIQEQYLEVYYACLLLGFVGMHKRNPSQWQQVKDDLARAAPTLLSQTQLTRITPKTYESTIVKPLELDTRPAFWGVSVLTVLFLILFFWFVGWNFNHSTQLLDAAVSTILGSH